MFQSHLIDAWILHKSSFFNRYLNVCRFALRNLSKTAYANRQKKWKNACKCLKHFDRFWMVIGVPDCLPKTFRKMRRENDHFLQCLKCLTVYTLQILSLCYTYFFYKFLTHNREPWLASQNVQICHTFTSAIIFSSLSCPLCFVSPTVFFFV